MECKYLSSPREPRTERGKKMFKMFKFSFCTVPSLWNMFQGVHTAEIKDLSQ